MGKVDNEYISKADCQRAGFVRTAKGVFKFTALERAYAKGRLDYGSARFGRDDRLKAGQRLNADYERARFELKTPEWMREKIDGKSSADVGENLVEVRSCYLSAIRHIPREFWPMVRLVCIENKLPEFDENLPMRRRYEQAYAAYCDLCRGLDRLIEYYVANQK